MAEPARNLLTVAELLDLPPDARLGGNPELWDGEVFYKAHPRATHGNAQRRIGSALGELEPDDPDAPGWWITVEVDWQLGPARLLRPDLAGWRRATLPELPEGAVQVRPDWVCEVLSPGREDHDLVFKARAYLEQGVPWYWVAHAEGGVLQVLRHAGAEWALHGTFSRGDVARIPPFEELELRVARLFPALTRPRTGSTAV